VSNSPSSGALGTDVVELSDAQKNAMEHPGDPTAWLHYGSAHYLLAGAGPEHYLEAHLAFERAMNMSGSPGAALGLASSAYTFGSYDVALELAQAAQRNARLPYREAELAEGGILLKLGRWEQGWKKCEARLDRPGSRTPRFTGKLAELKDKTVFVRGEQGFGDNIMFTRYIHKLNTWCGALIVEAPKSMATLMRYLVPVDAEIVSDTDRMLGDVQISIMSLPLLLGPMIGWEPIKPVKPSFDWNSRQPTRIGICPASLADSPTSLRKSPPPHYFNGLVDSPISLMWSDMEPFSSCWDWLDTARYLHNCCKLVISVDTAVAHLAATMGIPVWLLQRADSCWRWDHPNWYPDIRAFQQKVPGDWGPVFHQVREALV